MDSTSGSPNPSQQSSSTQQMAWFRLVQVHETLANNRMKFSITLSEMSDFLGNYVKTKENVRKKLKETELHYQKTLEDHQTMLEKARAKYQQQMGEWEKLLMKGNGQEETRRTGVSGIFSKSKTTNTVERMGQEAGVKAKVANEAYKRLLVQTNNMRREFYDVQLPKILASVMGLIEEVDQFLKFTLGKYAFTYESAVLADAITLKPMEGTGALGMVDMVGNIDSKADLDAYLLATARHGQGRTVDRASLPYREYEMSEAAQMYANPRHIFGQSLERQLERDQQRVPMILAKCAEAVERCGLEHEGIYRQSGQSSQVNQLRTKFDLNAEMVDLTVLPVAQDINNVTSVLKMYLRELPEGLIPIRYRERMLGLFEASSQMENTVQARVSLQQAEQRELPEKISQLAGCLGELPKPYKRTLEYLFKHLDRVQAFQEYNMMNSENLSIVFGPTLLPTAQVNAQLDIRRPAKLVKFVLDNQRAVFELINSE